MFRFAPAALVVLLIAGTACAQTKVGYVDINEITRKAKQVKTVFNEIEDKMQDLQKDIKDKTAKVGELRSEIRRNDGVLAKEEIDKKRKELTRLESELQELDRKARGEMQRIDDTRFEPLMKMINYTIQDIAKEQKYDLVLRGEAVLYGASGADLTAEVIRRLDAQGEIKADPKAEPKTDSKTEPITDEKKSAQAPETPTPTPAAGEQPAAAAPQATPVPAPAETPAAKATATPEAKATPTPRKAETRETKASGTRPVDRQPD
jgi:outer membrane protein